MSQYSGGGSWDEYCYCCGLPFYPVVLHLDEDPSITSEDKRKIQDKASSIKKQIKWLEKSIGLDSTNNLLFALGTGGDTGDMTMDKKQPSSTAQEIYENNKKRGYIFNTGDAYSSENPHGLAIHKDCVSVIESAIGRKLIPNDEILIRKIQRPNTKSVSGLCHTKYNEQFFPWEKVLLDDNFSLASPLVDKGQKDHILKCNSKLIKVLIKKSGNTTRKNKEKGRKSPSESATDFPVGTIKVGNNKKKWIVKKVSNGSQRWVQL
jgi:hypothetical protein